MSWVFEQANASRVKLALYKEVINSRREWENTERMIAANKGLHPNAAAVIPQDVWREMDTQTKELLRNDEGDVLLQDLMPLSKDLPIGKVVHQYRKASDSGVVQRSISGSTPDVIDKTSYTYGKAIVPVFRGAFGREWREWEAQRSENFDGLIDDSANQTRATRSSIANYFKDGDSSLVYDGQGAFGFTNSPDTVKFDLGAGGQNIDYTSSTETAENIRNGFKEIRDVLRITNNVTGKLTVYVSREIMSNWERYYSDNFSTGETILIQLLKLSGIAAIKETALLEGNEMFWTVLQSNNIRPLVGMPVNTIAIPRNNQMDDFNFLTWTAVGIDFLSDDEGKTGNLYAADLT